MKKFFSVLALLVLAVGLNAQNVYPNVQRNGILTSGRVPIVTTSGLLVDSSVLTFNGTILTAPSATLTATSSLLLGTAGSAVGNIGFRNATSGTATLAPPTGALSTYTVTLPNAASTLPIFGQQITFTGPTAARSIALPDAAFTVARSDAANTFAGIQTFSGTLQLNNALANPSYSQGALFYDQTDKTLAYYNENSSITVNVGQEQLIRVINNTGSTIANGVPVYISGASGGLPQIVLANASAEATSKVAGITTNSITNTSTGYITVSGVVHGMDTSAFTVGVPIYLGTSAGTLTTTAPTGSNYIVQIGNSRVNSASVGELVVTPMGGRIASGGAGTVSVVSSGSLTSTALVTGGGTTTLQTPSATATMDSSGNISTPGNLTVGNAATTAGAVALTQGTTASTGTTNITIQAPTSVTSYVMTLPGAVGAANTFLKDVAGNGVLSWATVTSGAGTFTPNAQTGTTYTLGSTDLTNVNANSSLATLVSMNNASSNVLTVPLNATTAFPVGTNILVQQLGAGATSIAATGGVTINTPSTLNLGVQYSMVSLLKTATDTWQLGAASLPSGIAVTSPVITTGLTASGSAANDFSASTGTFKTSTGAVTIGPGAVGVSGLTTFSAGILASGATANDFSGGSGTFKTSTGAVTIGGGTNAVGISGPTTVTGPAASTAFTISQTARTSGVLPYITWTIPTDTGQTASTESPGLKVATGTRTWATTGTVALQRENYFAGPTYASAGASQTFTDAFTMYLDKPIAGTNAIFTRAHSLGIVDSTSAASSITGGLVVSTTLGTAATSVGIGGGNVNAGGTITAAGAGSFANTTIAGAAATTALTITQTARTSGILPYIKYTIPTDTAQTASTESPGIQGVTGTRTWATTGTVALQREIFFPGPTYASASASQTFTDAFNMYLTPPVAGANAIFTRGHTLGIVDSTSSTTANTGGVVISTTLGTPATSVGIGGGNITAGGNIFASTSTGRIGYLAGSGVGTAVTQITSRTTGVTSNTPTGAITLFAAAGSATPATFTVSCTSIAAGDTVVISQASGTNQYAGFCTAISAGTSFNVTFYALIGTASDSPVLNYTIIKGSSN